MDPAAAAAMSDPDRNPQFRRRWDDTESVQPGGSPRNSSAVVGTLGLALLEAFKRRRQVERGQAAVPVPGDPSR